MYGDVDGNGQVQAYDATLILRHVMGYDILEGQALLNADVTLNDTVSALDASVILQYGVGLLDSLPLDQSANMAAQGELHLENGEMTAGTTVSVPVHISNGCNIFSYFMEYQYAPEALAYQSIDYGESLARYFKEITAEDGVIRICGAGSEADGENEIFATLNFTVAQNFDGEATTVSLSKLQLNENPVQENVSEAVLSNITSLKSSLPLQFALSQNYPNPFNPVTTIEYALPEQALVNLAVFNIAGQQVAFLVNASQPAGYHSIQFNPAQHNLSTGVYFYHLKAGDFNQIRKMVYIK